jgi:hypothetical protein
LYNFEVQPKITFLQISGKFLLPVVVAV